MNTEASSRRRFLSRFAATAGLAGVAGCLGGGDVQYTFSTLPVADSLDELTDAYLQTEPATKEAQHAIDYPEAYKRSVVETLLAEGTVDVVQWQLTHDRTFGTTSRPKPCFIENEGTYYSVVESDRTEITESRWVFYLDLVEEEPGDSATVITEPPSSLSETDRKIVQRALETVTSHSGPTDRGEYPLGGRGPIFHHQMDPAESDLVPSPPFDYVERDGNYFAAVAENGDVQLTQYTFTAREVATSLAELRRVVEREFVETTFDNSISSEVSEILRTATDVGTGRLYQESGSMSDGLTTITDRLGMLEYMPEDVESQSSVRFAGAAFRYEDAWYNGSLWTR